MKINANFERDVKKYGVDFVVVILGKLDPVLAFLRSQVGGVHVIHGTLGDKARFEHRAQVREDKILKALLADIVEQKRADHVAGERDDVMALEPGTLAGPRKSDGEDDEAFGRTRHGCGDKGGN